MKTVARNVECQIAPQDSKMNLKEIVQNKFEAEESNLISSETYGVFMTEDSKTSHKVCDEFSKHVMREVGFRQI